MDDVEENSVGDLLLAPSNGAGFFSQKRLNIKQILWSTGSPFVLYQISSGDKRGRHACEASG